MKIRTKKFHYPEIHNSYFEVCYNVTRFKSEKFPYHPDPTTSSRYRRVRGFAPPTGV